jgi:hypothetical protein
MTTAIACAACLLAGVVLGVAGEWQLLKPWVQLAMRQSEVLHGPRLVRTAFQPGEDDGAERSRIGRSS